MAARQPARPAAIATSRGALWVGPAAAHVTPGRSHDGRSRDGGSDGGGGAGAVGLRRRQWWRRFPGLAPCLACCLRSAALAAPPTCARAHVLPGLRWVAAAAGGGAGSQAATVGGPGAEL